MILNEVNFFSETLGLLSSMYVLLPQGKLEKMKTKRAAMKRFTLTGSGKIKRNQANKRHILTKKARKRKNRLGKPELVSSADYPRTLRLLQA